MTIMDSGDDRAYTTRGVKRLAEDELQEDSPLAKRFHLLNLDNVASLYTAPPPKPEQPPRRRRSNAISDSQGNGMQVEDTPNKVYIHDLDQEIADLESEEPKLIFIPDIEQRMNRVPDSVLQHGSQSVPKLLPTEDNQMVLYHVPQSLTFPPEKDTVRRAILETRARAREEPHKFTAEPASIDGAMDDSDSMMDLG